MSDPNEKTLEEIVEALVRRVDALEMRLRGMERDQKRSDRASRRPLPVPRR